MPSEKIGLFARMCSGNIDVCISAKYIAYDYLVLGTYGQISLNRAAR